jgi:hypothetical protein
MTNNSPSTGMQPYDWGWSSPVSGPNTKKQIRKWILNSMTFIKSTGSFFQYPISYPLWVLLLIVTSLHSIIHEFICFDLLTKYMFLMCQRLKFWLVSDIKVHNFVLLILIEMLPHTSAISGSISSWQYSSQTKTTTTKQYHKLHNVTWTLAEHLGINVLLIGYYTLQYDLYIKIKDNPMISEWDNTIYIWYIMILE